MIKAEAENFAQMIEREHPAAVLCQTGTDYRLPDAEQRWGVRVVYGETDYDDLADRAAAERYVRWIREDALRQIEHGPLKETGRQYIARLRAALEI